MKFTKLLAWSHAHYQELPWRQNRTLYSTLVSEIMLQQTTVGTVLKHFPRFIEQFPNLKKLSQASEEEMVMAWKGLGYYRRARNLLKAAREICEKFDGKIPLEREALLSINGIGPYTASALIAIGANKEELALDANLERVLSRLYLFDAPKGLKLQKQIRAAFLEKRILKDLKKDPRDLNEALMDLGRVFCQAKKADCMICPMKEGCIAYREGVSTLYPKIDTNKKETLKHQIELARIVVRKGDKILGLKRKKGEWLEGQIEVPTFVIESSDKELKQYPVLKDKIDFKKSFEFKSAITKYKINNIVVQMKESELEKYLDCEKELKYYSTDAAKDNLATSTLKILKNLDK